MRTMMDHSHVKGLTRYLLNRVPELSDTWAQQYVQRTLPQLEDEGLEGEGLLQALVYQARGAWERWKQAQESSGCAENGHIT